ncbi:GNAT family N-acetyltransferase [Pseudonocardia sp.]|uniref:GNAT family N-acetyltransferase n=1 Tax=Pseudonocardia sp. TaxID=60912 RepID=UPI00261F5D9D|nr:GNAT family N-acetyltransferase [Pseudonocardia sp.]
MAEPSILDVAERARFEIHSGGQPAGYLNYRLARGEIALTHTEIDERRRGQGLGGALVRGALDAARRRRLSVLPECEFAASWIARHPEYADLVPATRHPRFGLA